MAAVLERSSDLDKKAFSAKASILKLLKALINQ